ncbi:MAG: DUF1800 family protein [Saprospiraceae bacterium]
MASLSPKTSTLGFRLAAHLLRRTTYHITRARIDNFAAKTPQQAVNELLTIYPFSIPEPLEASTGLPWVNDTREPETDDFKLKGYTRAWWINEALLDKGIFHKMTFFFHAHLVTNHNETDTYSFWDHLTLLQYYALGNYKKLCTKMSTDITMLRYLNNNESNKDNPNENFARENFELFTVSKGPQISMGNYTFYTEHDIQEAARLLTGFTGWERTNSIDPENHIYRGHAEPSNHDTEDKIFSSAFQGKLIAGGSSEEDMWKELEAFYDMIFAQDETAKYITRRLYRYVVGRVISSEVENDIITPLAETLRSHNYEIKPWLSQLLTSQHFYDEDDSNNKDEIIGSLVKSPLDLALGAMSFLELVIPDVHVDADKHYNQFYCDGIMHNMLEPGGLDIFGPVNVAGYAAYYQAPGYSRSWFNGGTIFSRYRVGYMLLNGETLYGGDLGTSVDIVSFVQANIPQADNANNVVGFFVKYLLPEEIPIERYDYFLNTVFLNKLSVINWKVEWNKFVSSGLQDDVIIPLTHLVTALIGSPEYQLF